MPLSFIKMHGIGNDFIIFDARNTAIQLTVQQLTGLAARTTGIGCDQVIVMERARAGDVFMRIFNADGSQVQSCGNATRCVAWLVMEETGKDKAVVETGAGLLACERAGEKNIRVDMGQPKFGWQDIPLAKESDTMNLPVALGELSSPVAVSMGNPHMVFAVEDADAVDLKKLGPELEHHPLFPERANVSVAQVVDKHHVKLRVWERGSGLTLACGTAACATLAALHKRGRINDSAKIHLPGGTLDITWDKNTDHILMSGPVEVSFRGTVEI
jgi:diaminopimelate epimerase